MRRVSLLTLGLLAACGKGSGAPSATRTDSAGVEIVMNPGTDHLLDRPVTALDTIYDPASDTLLQSEARMLGLAVDRQGRLVLADGGFSDRRILRQGSDGAFHQVGRRGGGPGEYQMFSGVTVSPDGEILISDFGKRGFVRFGPDDAPLPVIPWATLDHGLPRGFPQDDRFVAGGIVVTYSEMSESTSVKRVRLATPTDSLLLAEMHEPAPKTLFFKSCGVSFMGAALYYPSPRWTGNAQMVALTTGDGYEISIWSGGKRIRVIRRAVPPRPATKELAMQDLGEGQRMFIGARPCVLPAAEIVEQQGIAPTIPVIKRLSMATDGTLWVERYTVKGETPLHDIFDPTGAYLGTLKGEIPWPQAWLPDGQYISVGANADSLPVVVRYGVGGAVRKE